MGAKITYSNKKNEAGEITYDLEVKSSSLKPIDVPAERAPSMIDDYPILAVAASLTNGISIFRGLSELKVKESDRLLGIYNFLSKNGIEAKIDSNKRPKRRVSMGKKTTSGGPPRRSVREVCRNIGRRPKPRGSGFLARYHRVFCE